MRRTTSCFDHPCKSNNNRLRFIHSAATPGLPTMRCLRLRSLTILPLCIALADAKKRGEQSGWPLQRERALLENGNVFGSDALRHSLSTQRQPYQDPFLDEPKAPNLNLSARKRQFEFRAGHEEESADEGSGKGYSSSSSSRSKSKSKGKGKGSSKSTMSSKSGGKGMMSKSSGMSRTRHPTFEPKTKMPTPSPTVGPTPVGTGSPTCSPISGFFPPDVSDFFQAPTGDDSDLQNELNSALNDIQVPSEFEQQCVQR